MTKTKEVERDLKIDVSVFNSLVEFQKELPNSSPHANDDGYGGLSNPSGLALLGEKDNLIDTAVYLEMSGGCWDAPTISFGSMDDGLKEMIKKNRVVKGLALIRHNDWKAPHKNKMSKDIRKQIINFKNSFDDITKTLWIVLADDHIRTYGVFKDMAGRLIPKEIHSNKIYDETNISEDNVLYKKREKVKAKKKALKEELQRKRKARQEEEEKEKKRKDEVKAKKEELQRKIDGRKEKTIQLHNGYCLILNGKKEYILWKNS